MNVTTDEQLTQAKRLLAENALSRALAVCESVLAADPSNARALDLKAAVLLRAGDAAAAIELLERVTRTHPSDPNLLHRLGRAQVATGNPKDAARNFSEALLLNPANTDVLLDLGGALVALGQAGEAARTFRKALAHENTATRATAALAHLAQSERRWADMADLCTAWCERDPFNPQAWRSRSEAHWELGQIAQALASYKESLKWDDVSADHLASFGRICLFAGDYEQATEALAAAVRMQPHNPDTLSMLALLHLFRGEFKEAESFAERTLAQRPNDVSGLRVLIELKRGHLSDARFGSLSDACKRTDIPSRDLAALHFLLGDCLDARGEFDQAFVSYATANGLLLEGAGPGERYDRKAQESFVASVTPPQERKRSSTHVPILDITPIFVVGMPRSGTTLIESILAAHSLVQAGGERQEMRRIAWQYYGTPALRERLDTETLQGWRDYYLRAVRPAASPFLVDKHPWNYDCVGLILQIFPQAKIVHIRRNPVETGLSIFRNQFANFMTFACSLEDIGHHYCQYARVVAHWEKHYADRILTLQYEQLVSDFESGVSALLSACGLPWEDQCVEFWTSPRTISTITAVAARKPVASGNGRAQHYAQHLTSLVRELASGDVDLVTGKLVNRSQPD
ncbi:MAG: sulfotransferase [Hyphomonadaceae bacterium]